MHWSSNLLGVHSVMQPLYSRRPLQPNDDMYTPIPLLLPVLFTLLMTAFFVFRCKYAFVNEIKRYMYTYTKEECFVCIPLVLAMVRNTCLCRGAGVGGRNCPQTFVLNGMGMPVPPPPKFWQSLGISTFLPPPRTKILPEVGLGDSMKIPMFSSTRRWDRCKSVEISKYMYEVGGGVKSDKIPPSLRRI